MHDTQQISTFKKWMIAIRPFALPASTMPVIFGTILAVVIGKADFSLWRFILAFLGMVILHSGANMMNDVFDFKMKIDRNPSPVSGAIVRGLLSLKTVLIASLGCLVIGSGIGLVLAWSTGSFLIIIGVIGVAIGVFYTFSPLALKYHALGDFAVFLNFGVLGSLGAWFVQTRTFSWLPVVWVIPMGLLVIGILHANNWRDTLSDSETGIYTIASLLGDRHSLHYYGLLIFGPFLILLALMIIPRIWFNTVQPMPFTFFITIFALPLAIRLWQRALSRKKPKNPYDFIALDGATAQMNLLFGLLCNGALLLHYLTGKFLG